MLDKPLHIRLQFVCELYKSNKNEFDYYVSKDEYEATLSLLQMTNLHGWQILTTKPAPHQNNYIILKMWNYGNAKKNKR